MYAPDALVFTGRAKRPEPAPLAAARRQRQISAVSDSSVEVADMDVQIVSNVAVASYTYQYHSAMTGSDGARVQKKTMFGRATQIFKIGDNGALQIVHEHLSAGEAPAVEKAQK